MAHKKKHGAPVPPGNQPHSGPGGAPDSSTQDDRQPPGGGAPFTDQDPKRRLGDYEGAGEHSIQQPGGLNDADH
jgi:hypothetical protein